MIKIFSAEQIREADAYTISHDSIKSIDLMERAATCCTEWISDSRLMADHFHIFCGTGNNGGDGLAIARLLYIKAKKVTAYIFDDEQHYSPDFRFNFSLLKEIKSVDIIIIRSTNDFPAFMEKNVVIDALLGTGINRMTEGLHAELIKFINRTSHDTISIDTPSGLFADKTTEKTHAIIQASDTLTFQFPKRSFFIPENSIYTGRWHLLEIGLNQNFINETKTMNFLVEEKDIRSLRKKRTSFSHKGNFGHALIVAGSYGKIGAAVLSAKACIKTGAGLVTAAIPNCGTTIMQTAIPEVMVSTDESEKVVPQVRDFNLYSSIGIGPGIGKTEEASRVLKSLIQNYTFPIVLDADALNLLSENKTWLSFLPIGCILTPHLGEFSRLAGNWSDSFECHQLQLDFSKKYRCYVVLKGHYTCITCPDGSSYFNPTGNPGMATAGSGDVLTGMLTALLSMGYSPRDAAIFGVYLHGLAGDMAARKNSQESMIASDIIEHIGIAYMMIS